MRAWTLRTPGPRDWLSREFANFLASVGGALLAGAALATVATWLIPGLAPEWQLAIGAGVGALGLLAAARSLVPALGETGANVLVIGRGDLAAKLCLDLLERQPTRRFDGTFDLGPADAGAAPARLDAAGLRNLVQRERITRIVVAEPDSAARAEVTAALLECRLLGVEVEDAVELYQRMHGKLWLEALDPGRLVFSRGFRLTPAYLRVKRLLDVVCALLLLIAAFPLMAAIALAVRLGSPGPVLFRQERVGQFGRSFTLLKFRSMRADAEAATGPTWARENDDRATPLGGVLRRFHLDELPQAINVLRGDLSFVGPRPERACFVEMLRGKLPFYDLRHYIKPGVTGWAQVRYPYAGSVEDSYEKLQYDLWYAQNVSLGLDLRILFATAASLFGGRGR
jgi:exopolysaccharide biosynthesis polyprenyl glycosylphosphotransferase